MKTRTMSGSLPRGAGFGRKPNRKTPKLLFIGDILQIGSRAQRRYAMRMIRRGEVKPMEVIHDA